MRSVSAALLFSASAFAVDYQLYNSKFPGEHYDSEASSTAPVGGPANPASVQTVKVGTYPDGFVTLIRDPSELFLVGGITVPTSNYISKVDPLTLAEIKRTSLDCPSSDCPANSTWAPSAAIHLNGYIYVTTEQRLWKLDNNINVVGYYNLPLKAGSYNSLKILSDGNIVVKGLAQDNSSQTYASMTIVTPDLVAVVPEYVFPEKVYGRISVLVHNGQEAIYVAGATTVTRYLYTPGSNPVLAVDPSWSYVYRSASDTTTTAAGIVSFIGNEAFCVDSAQPGAPTGPLHIVRVNLDNAADAQKFTPFPGTTNGYHLNKHLGDPVNNVLVVSDSNNKLMAGFRYLGGGNFTQLWLQNINSKVIASATATPPQLYTTEITSGGENVLIMNTVTGQILNRIPTGSVIPSVGIISIGNNSDIFYSGGSRTTMRIYTP